MTDGPEARFRGPWVRLWEPFWAVPAAVASVSLVLGLLVPRFDDVLGSPLPWVFQGGNEGARTLLSTIAGATISVTGLVFSITIVVLQLASSQFTPRVLGTFLESRVTQLTLGVFTGSFLYALTVLRTDRSGNDAPVPHTAVGLAYLYVVGTVIAFVWFVHHITNAVQVVQVMHRVRRQAVEAVARLHPEDAAPLPAWRVSPGTAHATLTNGDRVGYVAGLDSTALVRCAQRLDAAVELDVGPGDFVLPGASLGRVWGPAAVPDKEMEALLDEIHLARERDPAADPAFGARQLVDIAERALTPGVNDPTTAVQAIDQLHVLLRTMAARCDPPSCVADDDGTTRLVYHPQTFEAVLREAVEELAWYGRDAVRVRPRLEAMLADLAAAARAEHRSAVAHARRSLDLAPSSTGSSEAPSR